MKKWIYFIIAIALFVVITPKAFAACGDSITGGSGTIGAPYLISTPTELAAISNCLGSGNSSKYFKLDANIDLNVSPYNTGSGWTPIGTGSGSSGFYGKFNGDYHTISGLFMYAPSTSNYGLFGYTEVGAVVENIILVGVDVDGGNIYVGALVGYNDGTVQNSAVTSGSVKGFMRFGGLVGYNAGVVQRSFSQDTTVTQKAASNQCCVGGLIGGNESSGIVYDSYARSNLVHTSSGQGAFGGAIGNTYTSGAMSRLYSTGTITSLATLPAQIGGLVGTSYVSASSSYWDTESSGRATSASGTGKTTAEMKTQGTFSGWDFSTVWAIDGVNNDGYPYLLWQDFADVTAPTITNVSSDKTNGSYTVGEVIDIDVTFSEAVTSTGDVTMTLETGTTDQTCIFTVTSGTTGSCNYTVQAGDTSADLTVSSISGTIADASANAMSNFVPTTNLAANKALAIDTTAPTISTLSPAEGATGVSATANLVLTFDTAVDVETGEIAIKRLSDDFTIETVDVTSGFVTGTGTTTITVNPTTTLSSLTQYYIQVDATAFDDVAGNSYAGILDTTSWNFTTADTGVPAVSSFSPLDGAIDVELDANLVITFDEIVGVETGNISLYKSSDDSLVQAIDITGLLVTGTGTTIITINPTADFEYATEYYMQIDATSFDDTSSNSYAGILDETTWNFTTESEPVVIETRSNPTTGTSAATIAAFFAQKIIRVPVPVQTPIILNNSTTKQTVPIVTNRILHLTKEGTDVYLLQKNLNSLGFTIAPTGPGSPGNETHFFGLLTKKSIIEFQKKHGLDPDGIVGPITLTLINS